ncbi:MAG: type IV toxin-antitoxin system AbiEi family antitoxin, partial [Bacteroidota bacterium]|nr:type IV toxin-antitoxin system AbiEi family antitoxin [Bacteroidota bacterium]
IGGVNYLETAGNCFIHFKTLFIFINDQKVTPEREMNKSKLWKAAGVKFVFAILNQPELLNAPYRTIADNAKVALGTVGKLLEKLEKENFVKQGNRNGGKFLFLYRLDELLPKWTTIYNTALRPKLVLGKFRVIGGALLNDDPLPPGILWGGEMAGAKLTEYLKPEKQALYIGIPKVEAMKALKIVPDENGNIELVTVFWNEQLTNNSDFYEKQIVPLTIVYADLLNSHDSRNHETADRIKNKYLGK